MPAASRDRSKNAHRASSERLNRPGFTGHFGAYKLGQRRCHEQEAIYVPADYQTSQRGGVRRVFARQINTVTDADGAARRDALCISTGKGGKGKNGVSSNI